MTTKNRSLALVIEGIGQDATFSSGIAWATGRQTIASPSTFEVQGGTGSRQGLVNPPSTVAATVNPFDVSANGSAFSFRLHASSLAKQLFLARPLEPGDSLSALIDSDDTTLTLSGSNYTWSSSDNGSVVWIGDEAIRLGTFAAGPQFTGCTRAYYSTLAGVQPKGMNVWRSNPFVKNRRGILYVYDHDEATWEQAWQGFMDAPTINGTTIEISGRDLLAVLREGNINRGRIKELRWPGAPNSGQDYSGNMVALTKPSPDQIEPANESFSGKRVNKPNSTSPHWVAVQIAQAVYYLNYDNTTGRLVANNSTQQVDNGGTPIEVSSPQMDSSFETESPEVGRSISRDEDAFIREILVVDRLFDHGSSQTDPPYGDFRSSTRELKYPWHPVAISMALLTSGYSPDPGVAGTGPGGETPTAGDPSDLAGPTQLFTVSGAADEYIVGATGKHINDGAVCARRIGEFDTHDMYKRVASDLTVTWANSKTNFGGGSAEQSGGPQVSPDGTKCWCLATGDGTYGGNVGEFILVEFDMTNGSINWGEPLQHGAGGTAAGICTAGAIAYDATNGQIYAAVSDSGDEIKLVGDNGTAVATSGNDGFVGACSALGMAPDDSVCVIIGASEFIGKYTAPLTGTGTHIDGGSAGRVDLGTGGDTTFEFNSISSGAPSARIEPRRDGSDNTVIFVGGASTSDDPWLMEYDPDEPTVTSRVIDEVDVSADTGLVDSGTANCPDLAIDKDGKIYVLYVNAASGATAEYDIIRYNADLTKDLDFRSQGGVTFMDPLTYGLASRISVDESYNVIVFTAGGYAQSYSQ